MTLLTKILLSLLFLTTFGSAGFIYYKERQITQIQSDLSNQVIQNKTLVDNIQRSQSQYVSKDDLDAFAKQNNLNLAAIQSDIAKLGGAIDGLNNFVVSSTAQNLNNIPSTNTTPVSPTPIIPTVSCNGKAVPCPDTYGYLSNIQTLQIAEDFSNNIKVPYGSVSFNASSPTPWELTVPQRKYNVNTVIAHAANGETVVYNSMGIVTTDNKEYKIAIDSSQFVEQYPSPSWSFFAPKLYLGLSGGVNLSRVPVRGEITPTISASVISYGKTTASPDLTLVGVGLGYQAVSQKVGVEVAPIMLNVGNVMGSKVITNTYLAPTVGINLGGEVNVGAGLRVGL